MFYRPSLSPISLLNLSLIPLLLFSPPLHSLPLSPALLSSFFNFSTSSLPLLLFSSLFHLCISSLHPSSHTKLFSLSLSFPNPLLSLHLFSFSLFPFPSFFPALLSLILSLLPLSLFLFSPLSRFVHYILFQF